MAQDGEGLGSLVFANPTGILIKGDIEDPMEGVLDAPVLPHCLGEPHALGWQGSEKIPGLDLDWVVYLYPAGNAVASTSGTIPPFHHLCEGALPWYHTSFSTS
jgi:hypothetical protein